MNSITHSQAICLVLAEILIATSFWYPALPTCLPTYPGYLGRHLNVRPAFGRHPR